MLRDSRGSAGPAGARLVRLCCRPRHTGWSCDAVISAREPGAPVQPTDTVDKLCGGVAHELNNLLSVILGEADLALMFGVVNPEVRQSFVAIRRAGGQAAALTRQLLSFSQRQLVQPTVFNLSDVLRDESMD